MTFIAPVPGKFVITSEFTLQTRRAQAVDAQLDTFANGRLFIGKQAITAGLVDGVATMGEMMQKMQQEQEKLKEQMMRDVKRQQDLGLAIPGMPPPGMMTGMRRGR